MLILSCCAAVTTAAIATDGFTANHSPAIRCLDLPAISVTGCDEREIQWLGVACPYLVQAGCGITRYADLAPSPISNALQWTWPDRDRRTGSRSNGPLRV